ncbi:MAG: pilus assembly protein PilM, partial [Planctomycetaceae bacterium]|nr:pilus assembly protein PilM [Planctomycetaceae bacterium]
ATKAPDPRAVFQALRPVFNDYVSEIQRSIGYFSSVNREAKITKIVGAGNGFKLAGLQKFLQQNLQYEVERVDNFQALVGDAVLNAPLFQENVLSFVVPYGLALQALKLTRIHTTLLPSEIATARKIRRKKPWAVATAASLLFGLAMSTAGYSNVASSVSVEKFKPAEDKVAALKTLESGHKTSFETAKTENTKLKDAGDKLVTSLDTREMWLEVYRAINECLPRDTGNEQDIEDITLKNRINLKSVTAKKYTEVSKWFDDLKAKQPILDTMILADREKGPAGAGYVFTLVCEHYRDDPTNEAKKSLGFVRSTILGDLDKFEVAQPGSSQPVPVRKLGISHACITAQRPYQKVQYFPRGKKAKAAVAGAAAPKVFGGFPKPTGNPTSTVPNILDGSKKEGGDSESKQIDRTDFTIQFAWVPTPTDKRPAVDPLKPAATAVPVDPAAPANSQVTPTTPAAAVPPTTGAPVANPAIPATTPMPMPPAAKSQ